MVNKNGLEMVQSGLLSSEPKKKKERNLGAHNFIEKAWGISGGRARDWYILGKSLKIVESAVVLLA